MKSEPLRFEALFTRVDRGAEAMTTCLNLALRPLRSGRCRRRRSPPTPKRTRIHYLPPSLPRLTRKLPRDAAAAGRGRTRVGRDFVRMILECVPIPFPPTLTDRNNRKGNHVESCTAYDRSGNERHGQRRKIG